MAVVVHDGGVGLFVYEAGVAGHPAFRGVAPVGHALEEQSEGRVEEGGHHFEEFRGDSVRSWGFSVGHVLEAFVVPTVVELTIKHGWGEGGCGGGGLSPRGAGRGGQLQGSG